MEEKLCVLLVESKLEVVGPVRAQLERAGYKVEVAYTPDAALARVRTQVPDALLAGVAGLDGESLVTKARALDPALAIGLVSPADDDALDWRAEAAGADACLAGGLSGANLDSCVRSLVRIGALRRRLKLLERKPPPSPHLSVEIEIAPEQPADEEVEVIDSSEIVEVKDEEPKPIQGASAGGFDFFRRLLLVEVHRSRRYKYPLAFLLAAMDGWKERAAPLPPRAQAAFMGKVLRTVVKSIRDVDLAALYGADRFVVFMPHTPPDGAKLVANRLRDRIAMVEGELTDMTVSMGLACYDGEGNVSYGTLLREATMSLKKAQADGGNRVEYSNKLGKSPKPKTSTAASTA